MPGEIKEHRKGVSALLALIGPFLCVNRLMSLKTLFHGEGLIACLALVWSLLSLGKFVQRHFPAVAHQLRSTVNFHIAGEIIAHCEGVSALVTLIGPLLRVTLKILFYGEGLAAILAVVWSLLSAGKFVHLESASLRDGHSAVVAHQPLTVTFHMPVKIPAHRVGFPALVAFIGPLLHVNLLMSFKILY